jgi:hypothetical protein
MSDDTIKQYFKTAFLDRGMKNEDYYRYAPTAKYTATAYHRAAGASGTEGDNGNGIILRNHYRCTPSIIQFCSPNYPGGLQILSDDHRTATEPHLLAYHVEGNHTHNTNPEEINAVEAVITSLLTHSGIGFLPVGETFVGMILAQFIIFRGERKQLLSSLLTSVTKSIAFGSSTVNPIY